MDRGLPPSGAPDWHIAVRLSVYPDRASLRIYHYRVIGMTSKASTQIVTPRELDRPRDMWGVVQSLSLGVDILSGKYFT